MLDKNFKHSAWFKGESITVKQFLDYVLSHSTDFIIKEKSKANSSDLFAEPEREYYLSDRRYSMKLGYQERNYLAEHDKYFRSKLPPVNKNYMMAVIAVSNEPIQYDGDLVSFSR